MLQEFLSAIQQLLPLTSRANVAAVAAEPVTPEVLSAKQTLPREAACIIEHPGIAT
jgi:hypothetical protein